MIPKKAPQWRGRTFVKPLTGIDATFLYMETPETPMHVAGLTLYQPPADLDGSFFDHFKAFFLERIHLAPSSRRNWRGACWSLTIPAGSTPKNSISTII
jgi:diacylglycerol O-acyltransferase